MIYDIISYSLNLSHFLEEIVIPKANKVTKRIPLQFHGNSDPNFNL
jgi:hypothetical protein